MHWNTSRPRRWPQLQRDEAELPAVELLAVVRAVPVAKPSLVAAQGAARAADDS